MSIFQVGMKNVRQFLFAVTLAAGSISGMAAQSATIQIDVSATNNSSDFRLAQAVPIGNTVTGTVLLDVAPGAPSNRSNLTLLSAVFTWENRGTQTFTGSRLRRTGGSSIVGSTSMYLTGAGPTIGAYSVTTVGFNIHIGADPFTTTEEFADLLSTQSSILSLVVGVKLSSAGGGNFGFAERFDGNITSTIQAVPIAPVPLPATLPLMAFALGGAGFIVRRRANKEVA